MSKTQRIYPLSKKHMNTVEASSLKASQNPPAAHEHLRVNSLANLPNMPDLSKHKLVYCGDFPAFFDPATRAVMPKPLEMEVTS